MEAARFSSSMANRTGGASASRSSIRWMRGSSGISVGAPSSITTTRRTERNESISFQNAPSSERSTNTTSSSAWLTT